MYELIENFSDFTFDDLLEIIDFEQRSVTVYGKTYPQPRLTSWYGPVDYTYSNLTWEARDLPPLLLELQKEVEDYVGEQLPTVLANLYRDGSDKIGWHSDDEEIFGADVLIASLSFGEPRDFKLRRKDRTEKADLTLRHGSLLIMKRGMQRSWEHSLPARKKVDCPRINLTFRTLARE